MVKWISQQSSELSLGVRVPLGTHFIYYDNIVERGYGLVVEHVLAKDETGVRFSLPAPSFGDKSGDNVYNGQKD